MKRFELVEHTADVAVQARGDTLGEVFAAVADGLAAAMCDEIPEAGEGQAAEVEVEVEVEVEAESREALLFDYLDELIYLRDVREVLPVDHRARVERADDEDRWRLEGSFRGVPFASVVARDVKAVTYSQMRLEPVEEGWEAYVVFDV